MNREPDLVSVPEAARRYGISPWTYKTLSERGELPAIVRVGRQQRVGTAAIAAHIASLTGLETALADASSGSAAAVDASASGVAGPRDNRGVLRDGEAATVGSSGTRRPATPIR